MLEFDKYAFIDESGNDSLEVHKEGVSGFYVLVGLVARPPESTLMHQHFCKVKADRFPQASEMKSELIGNKDNRRRTVLHDLVHPDYDLYAIVVDKARLTSEGLRHPKTFTKFLLERLVDTILARAEHPCIQCDEIKDKDFMEGAKKYLARLHPRTLFRQWNFAFQNSIENVCIQAADVIAGSIARCWERTSPSPESDEFMQILGQHLRSGHFDLFPAMTTASVCQISAAEGMGYADSVEREAIDRAQSFLDRCGSAEDRDLQAAAEFAKALLEFNLLQGREVWISTEQLRDCYLRRFAEDLSEHKIRTIIGALRDAGLLVASRSKGGYKLPTCEADLYQFVNRYNSQIDPMVARVRKARDIVKSVTDPTLDILQKDEFHNLRMAIDSTPDWDLHRILPQSEEEDPAD